MGYNLKIYLWYGDKDAPNASLDLFSVVVRIVELTEGRFLIIANRDYLDFDHQLVLVSTKNEYDIWCPSCGWVSVKKLSQVTISSALREYHCSLCDNLLLELYDSTPY